MNEGPTVLVTSVGAAAGARAAAAALACAGSASDRAGLLIDLSDGRALRSSLIATAGARQLEERLATHLPEVEVASCGQICQLSLSADLSGIEQIAAVLPLARESVAAIHMPPRLLQPVLAEARIRPSGAMLRADLSRDRALTALVARDLITRGLRVAVVKRPPAWLAGRLALLGAPQILDAGMLTRAGERLLKPASHLCYNGAHDAEADPARAAQQQRRDHEGA